MAYKLGHLHWGKEKICGGQLVQANSSTARDQANKRHSCPRAEQPSSVARQLRAAIPGRDSSPRQLAERWAAVHQRR